MKRLVGLITIMLTAFILISCAAGRYPYPKANLAKENWQRQIDSDPERWAEQASPWFRAGRQTQTQIENENAPITDAMSRTVVNVPNFEGIKINGDFKVQMSGAREANSVNIVGPNDAIRSVAVRVRNNVLCLEQVGKKVKNIGRVTVYVGVKALKALVHSGKGNVEGIKLYGKDVTIESSGSGCIYLAGRLNVKCITTKGTGSVILYGTNITGLDIKTFGSGHVNVFGTGQVLLKTIRHRGGGDINIINATSNGLIVDADGTGKIGIRGRVNIKNVTANGKTCVFITTSSSNLPCIYVNNDARVGVQGRAGTLYAFTTRTAKFYGRTLLANDAYAVATGASHMNLNATNRVFATAKDYASIYFFGDPIILTAFEEHSGTVVTLGENFRPIRYQKPKVKKKKRRHRNYKDDFSLERLR